MRWGDANNRIDVGYHSKLDTGAALKKSLARWDALGALLDVIESGSAVKASDLQSDGLPIYEVGNVGQYALKAPFEYSARKDIRTLQRGDIVTGRVGSIGTFALHDADVPIGFTDNILRLRLKPAQCHRARFLLHFLNSSLAGNQIDRLLKGSIQRVINQTSLKSIVIPALNGETEARIAIAMEDAWQLRLAKFAEADTLLSSLDDYLLDILGIAPPPTDARRAYAVRLDAVSASRFDPDYFHPERILTVRNMEQVAGRLRCAPLREMVAFRRDQLATPGDNYLSMAHVQSHTGELVPADDSATGSCFIFAQDDVLFGRLRPYLNKVHRAERAGCCSTEFHVLRPLPGSDLLPDYLATVLRSALILAQTRHMMTGNTHPRLANDDMANLIIPIPDTDTQTVIAAEVRDRREQARQLRLDAEAGWLEAKRWFEEQLLGPAT